MDDIDELVAEAGIRIQPVLDIITEALLKREIDRILAERRAGP